VTVLANLGFGPVVVFAAAPALEDPPATLTCSLFMLTFNPVVITFFVTVR
jgi:hypothetical protein